MPPVSPPSHTHGHAPHAHPPQPVDWSILRMGMPSRLGLALTVSAILWLTIWLALR